MSWRAGAIAWIGLCASGVCVSASEMAFVRVDGASFVTEAGAPIALRGVNLGNWLLLEPWMFGLDEGQVPDQRTIVNTLESRFGAVEAERLLDLHRAGWMAQRDFDQIAALGFNAVRVPLWWGLIADEGEAFRLRADAWEWTDAALSMASQAGLYVLFDMHGAPGGQSLDQPSGDVTQNGLWTSAEDREQLAWLWQHFARRYKNEPAFLGYDLLNEPYGDFQTDHRQDLIEIVDRAYRVVREIDPDRPILLPGALEGIGFYGDPDARGWSGVAFTEHFYPAVFDGNERSLGTHARFWRQEAASRRAIVQQTQTPYVLGEFNPIWEDAGGPATTAAYFAEAEALGWGCFVWCYKRMEPNGGVGPNNWSIVSNAAPWTLGDLNTTPKAMLEARFGELATMDLALDQALADALTGASPAAALPAEADLPGVAPGGFLAGWAAAPVGVTTAAGVDPDGSDGGAFHGAGRDIFGDADEMGFLFQSVNAPTGNFGASVTIERFESFRPFAKAGLMARASLDPASPHIFAHAFRDGRVLVAWRSTQGGPTGQTFVRTSGFPLGLALGRQNGQWRVRVTDADGQYQTFGVGAPVTLGTSVLVGLAANSGVYGGPSSVSFDDLRLDPLPTVPPAVPIPTSGNFVSNFSFESPGGGGGAAGWAFLGQQVTRETGWTPVRSGSSLMAYRHWQVTGSGSSAAVQTVSGLTPGARHEVAMYVNADDVPAGKRNADRIEVRVETVGSGAVVLESRSWEVEDIETGGGWSRLVLPFRPTGETVNVRIVMYPEPNAGQRDGAVKFDDVSVSRLD